MPVLAFVSLCIPSLRSSYLEQCHDGRLDRLALINDRLRSYFDPADLRRVDGMLLEQVLHHGKAARRGEGGKDNELGINKH